MAISNGMGPPSNPRCLKEHCIILYHLPLILDFKLSSMLGDQISRTPSKCSLHSVRKTMRFFSLLECDHCLANNQVCLQNTLLTHFIFLSQIPYFNLTHICGTSTQVDSAIYVIQPPPLPMPFSTHPSTILNIQRITNFILDLLFFPFPHQKKPCNCYHSGLFLFEMISCKGQLF